MKNDKLSAPSSPHCYVVTVVYRVSEGRVGDDDENEVTEKGTYAKTIELPFPPFIGLGLPLDPDGAPPYVIESIQLMRNGRVVVTVDSIIWPMRWGWQKVSDHDSGVIAFY